MVGLVEDGDLDLAEVAVTLADEVLEAAGAGQDDVDALAQALTWGFWPTPPKTVWVVRARRPWPAA